MRANTDHTYPALTKTAAPDPAAPAAVRSGKINSNRARPTDSQTASPSPPTNQDSDVTLMASIGESDGGSDNVESAENSPTSPANTPDLEGYISEMEEMHKVSEGELIILSQPTVIFYRIDELELTELDNAETDPPENHQDNGATPKVNTRPSPSHSPLEDASVASAAPPTLPRVEAGNTALQLQERDLPDIRLLRSDYMLYGVYQDWVHQFTGEHLDVGIAEDSKWQVRWEKLVCMPTQQYDTPFGKVGKRFVGILSV